MFPRCGCSERTGQVNAAATDTVTPTVGRRTQGGRSRTVARRRQGASGNGAWPLHKPTCTEFGVSSLTIRPAGQDDLDFLWDFLAIAAYEPDADAARAVPIVAAHLTGWQWPGDFGVVAAVRARRLPVRGGAPRCATAPAARQGLTGKRRLACRRCLGAAVHV